jgi:hypothetical protein
MNESSSNPASDSASIAETLTTTLRQPSFLRVMLVLSATVVVLVGIRLGAPILNTIFFALVLTVLFSPIYSWLKRRGLPAPHELRGERDLAGRRREHTLLQRRACRGSQPAPRDVRFPAPSSAGRCVWW